MGIDNCLEFLKIAEFGEKFSLCEASVRSTLLEFIVRIQHQEDKCEVFVRNRYLFKVFPNISEVLTFCPAFCRSYKKIQVDNNC